MEIEVEVVFAAAHSQTILNLLVPENCTISNAIEQSGVLEMHPELGAVDQLNVGIFGKLRSLDWNLQAGDRIEIYRQLAMDPKDARKVRAKQQAKHKKIQKLNSKDKKTK
jgi:putative ubiquitin-RnfH superfamily antitoxin RatB of RatAB toxin-antitoxin module